MTKSAFAIGAHPDDIEFVMSGTMMHLRDVGYELHYMNVADGSCGSTQHDAARTARIRRDESRAAAEFLGASFHECITQDLAVFFDRPTLARLASIVREVAPEIVFTHSPQDYMEDHMNTSRLVLNPSLYTNHRSLPSLK